jgi:hypothetical protein
MLALAIIPERTLDNKEPLAKIIEGDKDGWAGWPGRVVLADGERQKK